MFKSRRRIAEEEAKKDPNYIPTKDLKAEGDEEAHIQIPWTGLIIVGVLVLLMIACIVVICVFKK